jgi:NAD(P)-dependent dehydrogenase (short-subunit alcohol dehydrogenase family)
MRRLEGKTAVVTGAGSGIGRAVAQALAAEGAFVVLSGRTRDSLDATARELIGFGPVTLSVSCDVTEEQQVVHLFKEAARVRGTVDLLVNNAGAFDGGPLDELSLAAWQHVLAVNLTGPFLCTREAMRLMKNNGGGRIINVGSISAQVPRMDSAAYAASKHGLVGLTKAAALEGREHGIAVCCIHPGNVAVERRKSSAAPEDAESMMSPEELAEIIRTMATLPAHLNMFETIVLPVGQAYLGRG